MDNEIWMTVISVAGILSGVLIGARLSSNAAINLMTQQAKAEFYSRFTDTLVQLHTPVEEPGIGEAMTILQKHYPGHLAAFLKLKATVPTSRIQAIEAAWNKYTKDSDHELQEEKEMYRFAHVLNGKTDEEMRMLAIKRVNGLIDSLKKT